MSRPCQWDGVTLPYRPEVPVLLCWYGGAKRGSVRVVVPDAEGYYWHLVPGRQYLERQIEPALMFDCTVAHPKSRDAATQVDWYDLPPIKATDMDRFLPSDAPPMVTTALRASLTEKPARRR
jgi:hypothetical protein